jgi:hypothetical protein
MRYYDNGDVDIKDSIIFVHDNVHIETVVGRVVFNSILPENVRFINETVTKK